MDSFLSVVFFSTLAGFSTLVGIYLVALRAKWAQKNSVYLISFAAGVLLSSAIAFLIPESFELSGNSVFPVLLFSFLFFYILEHTLLLHRHSEAEHYGTKTTHPFGLISLIGLFFHSLIDGISIGVGFEVSQEVGILTTMAVILHELPEGVASISVLLHAGYKKEKAVHYSWVVALATPVGAVITSLLIQGISENILGVLIALAAGSFLYVSAADLIPEIQRRIARLAWVFVLSGVFLPFLIEYFL